MAADGQGGGRSGGGGGGRRGGGRGSGGGRPPGGRPPGGRSPGGGRPKPGGHSQQTPPIEIAVRSTRNAITRHADGLRDDQVRLACRAVLMGLHGNLVAVSNPGELLGVIEQVQHVLFSGRREDAQLPVALRAVVAFTLEDVKRAREVQELLRQLLRHLYALSSDYIGRQLRDDGRFRATSMLDVLEELARTYLDDARFAELRGGA